MLFQKPGIYKITNLITNTAYIGQSLKLSIRWTRHKAALNTKTHKNEHLQRSWTKYSSSAFTCEALEYIETDDLLDLKLKLTEREYYWIMFYKNNGISLYNVIQTPTMTNAGCLRSDVTEALTGTKNHQAKLTEEQAISILTIDKDLSLEEVSEKYNITYACAKDLRLRRSWKHLDIGKVASRCLMSEETKEQLTNDLINQTISNDDLCIKYNISMSSVQKLKRSLGLTSRNSKQLKIRVTPNGNKGKTLDYAQGSKNINCKLTEEQVREIKQLLKDKKSCMFIAKLYGVSNVTIGNIRDGNTWKHISI
jgi:group I intron endonuclease